jgi:hypothetical protein
MSAMLKTCLEFMKDPQNTALFEQIAQFDWLTLMEELNLLGHENADPIVERVLVTAILQMRVTIEIYILAIMYLTKKGGLRRSKYQRQMLFVCQNVIVKYFLQYALTDTPVPLEAALIELGKALDGIFAAETLYNIPTTGFDDSNPQHVDKMNKMFAFFRKYGWGETDPKLLRCFLRQD